MYARMNQTEQKTAAQFGRRFVVYFRFAGLPLGAGRLDFALWPWVEAGFFGAVVFFGGAEL